MPWYIWITLLIAVIIFSIYVSNKMKRERLMQKYNDAELVEKLMSRMFWQGQTKDQLMDSLGKPKNISQQVLKTKTKEIWKYHETGKNRYDLKITLEDDQVVGWDQK